jgi:hypothetical protein
MGDRPGENTSQQCKSKPLEITLPIELVPAVQAHPGTTHLDNYTSKGQHLAQSINGGRQKLEAKQLHAN